MTIAPYAYAYTRIRARMGDILSEEDLKRLIDARDKAEFLAVLMASPYKDCVMKVPSGELGELERALKEELVDQYLMVIRSTSGELRAFFEVLLQRLEVENLKMVIRAKAAPMVVSVRPSLFPVEPFFGRAMGSLMELKSLESVVKLVEEPYKAILEAVFPEYERSKKVVILEHALDKALFRTIWEATERLRPADREIVWRILGTEFDIENLKTLLRCKADGIKEEEMVKYFFPYGYALHLESPEARALLSAGDVSAAIRLLASPYAEELLKALPAYEAEGSLIALEHALEVLFLRVIRATLRRSLVNIGTILSFLFLKEAEMRNLYAIAVCKENEIPAERIKKLIIPAAARSWAGI